MDTVGIASSFAGELVTHHKKLEGRAGEAQRAQDAFRSAARAATEQRNAHEQAADALLGSWRGKAADGFEKRTTSYGADLATTADAGEQAAEIVAEVTRALQGRHGTVGALIDDFMTKASQLLKAGLAVVGLDAPAGLMRAMAGVGDLVGRYLPQTGGQLEDAKAELAEAARRLRELDKELRHDGVADPGPGRDEVDDQGGRDGGANEDESGGNRGSSAVVDKILDGARDNIGYHERGDNINKWGPSGAPWCSYFAMSMWEEAGVDINADEYGYTGNVYRRGQELGTAYDESEILEQARPGDAILFGSGPENSRHIGIIEKVEGTTITTIEGNWQDSVQRRTYTMPEDRDEFYGGVHPK